MSLSKKTLIIITLTLFLFIVTAPIVIYEYSLSLIDEMPVKPNSQYSEEDISEQWQAHEHCSQSQCASITPYWIYRFLICGVFNDIITPLDENFVLGNFSTMASSIAMHHLRQGHFKGRGMLWWHLTNINLTIWVQRNWKASHIVTKFNKIRAAD